MLGWGSLVLPPSVAALAGAYLVAAGGSVLLAILLVGVSFWLGLLLYGFSSEREVRGTPSLRSKEGMPAEVELLDEGVRQASRAGESTLRWEAFHQVLESGGALYLIFSGTGVVIPARVFSSSNERREAIEWIYPRLTKEARARSSNLSPTTSK